MLLVAKRGRRNTEQKQKSLIRGMSAKYQIVVPAWFRKKYHLTQKSQILLEDSLTGLLIKPVDDPLEKARGALRSCGKSAQELKDEIRKEELQYEIV